VGHLRDIVKLSRRAMADINQIDLLIAVSQATKNWHVEQGLDPQKTLVIHNGVDLKLFCPASFNHPTELNLRGELGIPADVPLLLFVGQIGIRKGVDILLTAFELIAKQHPACQLLIVGQRNSQKQESVEYESQLHQTIERSLARHRIHWLGRRSDVAEIMQKSSILIHPARQEPLGRVLLEAAACGLPLVTTDVGGSSEILKSLSESELLQPLDAHSIANRVGRLLQDKNERVNLSGRLRVLAETQFSDDRCAAAIGACYSHLPDLPAKRGTQITEK
jgi:glycosyltransferase involved in cell wall biosynthesis